MTVKYIDSHAHLTSDSVFPQVDELLARAQAAGVTRIVNICTDPDTLAKGMELQKRYPWVYNTAATTPHDVEKEGEEAFPYIAEKARLGNLVAVGETGLDYFHHHSPPDKQQHFFRRYLKLALECKLPVVIHCRDAFADFFKILDEEYIVDGQHAPGVLHCFTGTVAEAEEVIKRGWYLSLSGIVTFKKSEVLRKVAEITPLDRLLVETDTPYLAPQSKRGKVNEPSYLLETVATIASLKGVSVEEVAKFSSQNATNLFKLDSK